MGAGSQPVASPYRYRYRPCRATHGDGSLTPLAKHARLQIRSRKMSAMRWCLNLLWHFLESKRERARKRERENFYVWSAIEFPTLFARYCFPRKLFLPFKKMDTISINEYLLILIDVVHFDNKYISIFYIFMIKCFRERKYSLKLLQDILQKDERIGNYKYIDF